MKYLKIFLSLSAILIFIYMGVSWFLLDGKLIYYTSFNESTIQKSKKEDLFVSSDLDITAMGDSLVNWRNKIEVWTNKRYEIKYFGILFHWTYTRPEWRYLNISFNEVGYQYKNNWCEKTKNGSGYSQCCNRIGCNVGDTIVTDFFKCNDEEYLGTLQVVVK